MLMLFVLLSLHCQTHFHQIQRSKASMKIAALLLLQLFVFLCRTAVVTNPKQILDSTKAHVDRRTILQRGSGNEGSDTSSPLSSNFESNNIDKSPWLILKPDVRGPPERLFDWDFSCADPEHRQKIWDAYNMALQLAKDAEMKLGTLANGLLKRPAARAQPENQNWIAEKDPA